MKTILLLLAILTSIPSFAAEKVKVFWDCNLDGDMVSCIDLKLAYFANPSLEDVASASSADLKLYVRVIPLNNEVEYRVNAQWKDSTPLPYPGFRLNSTLSSSELLEKLLVFLNDVTKPYVSIANNGTVVDTNSKDKPYYINPYGTGSGNQQQGYTSLSGTAEVIANYSNKQWRLVGATYAGMNYSNVQKTPFNPGITTNITYYGAQAAVVKSVVDLSEQKKGQWDVAIFVNDRVVKNNIEIDGDVGNLPEESLRNTSRKTVIRAGTEWIAVPFLTDTSNGNIAIRYSLAGEHHKYVDPGSFQYIQETFAKHLVEVYLAKHFPKVDVKLNAGAFASSFREKPLKGVNGSLEVTYKINPRMTIGASGTVQYTKNRVLSTAEDNNTSFSGLTSSGTPLTYNGSITLSYTLGSIRIFNKEQRWKN